jgi:hypothetical protein
VPASEPPVAVLPAAVLAVAVPPVAVPPVALPPGEEDAEPLAVGSDNAAGVLPLKKWM